MESRSIVLPILCACALFLPDLGAQENPLPNNNLLGYYNDELFKWDYHTPGGFKLTYQDQSSTLAFGIQKNMAEALKVYPDTAEYYESYRKKNITGNILLWSGFSIALGSFIIAPIVLKENAFTINYPKVLAISLGGVFLEIIAAFILPSGYESLFNSVNRFNRHKLQEYKGAP